MQNVSGGVSLEDQPEMLNLSANTASGLLTQELKYGRDKLEVHIPEKNLLAVLEPEYVPPLEDLEAEIRKSLDNPIGSSSLYNIACARRGAKVVIIVSDLTRPIPYRQLLPPIFEELHRAGISAEQITCVIANGIHHEHTASQNEEIFGPDLLSRYKFVSHNSAEVVNLGILSTGNPLLLNRHVAEAGLVIATGSIAPHYFAGFSGGRKAILPGVAGRSTIENNHRLMLSILGKDLPLDQNPLNLEMIEAARMAGLDFIINVVVNTEQQIVEVVAGDMVQAWKAGFPTCERTYRRSIPEKADVTIVSPGGYPKDMNIYQAQKALANAEVVTRDGGIIILVAQCQTGLGDEAFQQWIESAHSPSEIINRIKAEFMLGAHKAFGIARIAEKKEVLLVSELDERLTEKLFMKKLPTPDAALIYAHNRFGEDYTAIVIPHGGYIQPFVE